MNIKSFIEKFYFIKKIHLIRARKKLTNKNFTLLASNCIGGIIYNNLGLKFLSPTINMQMLSNEFADFILNFDEYMKKEIKFIEPDKGIPVGMLGNMKIHFTHYKTNEEALEKWNERKKRINYNNIYVILNDRDGITEEQIRELGNTDFKNICVFTSKKYPNLPYTFYVPKYKNQKCIGNVLKKSRITGMREFETYFDYVSWLNSSIKENKDYRK